MAIDEQTQQLRRRLVIARDRTVVRRGAIAKVEHQLVHITPSPALGWVITFNDRMARLMKVLRGVAVRRVVATADMSASPAEPQMRPFRTGLQTPLAAERAWRHVANGGGMVAFV